MLLKQRFTFSRENLIPAISSIYLQELEKGFSVIIAQTFRLSRLFSFVTQPDPSRLPLLGYVQK